MAEQQLHITLVDQETFMGDHAESLITAVAVLPGETVEELVNRVLGAPATLPGYRDSKRMRAIIQIRVADIPNPTSDPDI